MKKFWILCFVGLVHSAMATWTPSSEVNGTTDGSSYGIGFTSFYSDYFATYFYNMYPDRTNHIYELGRSGSGWNGDYQQQWERWGLPLWASFKVDGYDWVLANDNEGLVSNTTYSAWQLIKVAPGLLYNGTAQTNEGVSTVTITHIPMGRVPHDGSDGDSGAIAGNAGSMKAAVDDGVPVIDLWHRLWTNSWSTDVVGSRILGFSSGSHPLAPGGLSIAYHQLLGLDVETNVGAIVFNYYDASASGTHASVSSVSLSDRTLSGTVLFGRMPMSWDSPDGTITNNANGAFVAMPSIGNAFNWIVQVTNLPAGNYTILVDGHFADYCSSVLLAAGRNWATNTVSSNPLWLQRASVLAKKRHQKGADAVTLATAVSPIGVDLEIYKSNAGGSYTDSGNRGAAHVAAVATAIAGLKVNDVAIHDAAQQTNHLFQFILDGPNITNLSVGTLSIH